LRGRGELQRRRTLRFRRGGGDPASLWVIAGRRKNLGEKRRHFLQTGLGKKWGKGGMEGDR